MPYPVLLYGAAEEISVCMNVLICRCADSLRQVRCGRHCNPYGHSKS